MNKYYFQDIYLLEEDELFQSRDTMIEYVRDNWKEYCLPIGEEQKLVSIQDWDSKIVLTYSVENEDGETETDEVSLHYQIKQTAWLVSELDRMVARV
jgi:hypothetical protein